MTDLFVEIARLLPKAVTWAESQSAAARNRGVPLTVDECRLADSVGVRFPHEVRVLEQPAMPQPSDPELGAVARAAGLLGPEMVGLTLGHCIFVLEGSRTNRLMSHELRHVYQYEQAGSISAFLPVYLLQIAEYGYVDAPFEVDARSHEMD